MRSPSAAGVRLPKFMAPRARVGGAPGALLGIGLFMAGILLPRFAGAHTPGVSTVDLTVDSPGVVGARIELSAAEPAGLPGLTDEGLDAWVARGILLEADGAPCRPSAA